MAASGSTGVVGSALCIWHPDQSNMKKSEEDNQRIRLNHKEIQSQSLLSLMFLCIKTRSRAGYHKHIKVHSKLELCFPLFHPCCASDCSHIYLQSESMLTGSCAVHFEDPNDALKMVKKSQPQWSHSWQQSRRWGLISQCSAINANAVVNSRLLTAAWCCQAVILDVVVSFCLYACLSSK